MNKARYKGVTEKDVCCDRSLARTRIAVALKAGALPDRYADPRPIGRGGMGQIYLAEDRELGRKEIGRASCRERVCSTV